MLDIEIKDINNNSKGKIQLSEEVFNNGSSEAVVHSAVVGYLANQRQGTHATKTRGLVSGGGKKPWKQKSTGRARSGSSRSPVWRGGGTVFGPSPRDYSVKLAKNVRKAALFKSLTMKLSSGELTVIDSISFAKPKTKDMLNMLKTLNLHDRTLLLVVPDKDENIMLSVRNVPTIDVVRVGDLNAYQVSVFNHILFTKDALLKLQGNVEVAAV